MLPPGHLAVGYITYSIYTNRLLNRPPHPGGVVLLALGTQFPDLVDKPLALLVGGFFTDGRMLGHSLLLGVLCVLLVGVAVRSVTGESQLAVAFGTGYLTHPLADAFQFVLQGTVTGDLMEVSFLFWPLVVDPAVFMTVVTQLPVLGEMVAGKEAWTRANLPAGDDLYQRMRVLELVLLTVGALLWRRDGYRGARRVRRSISALYQDRR